MSVDDGPMTEQDILRLSKREYANGVYAESTIAFARALLRREGERLVRAAMKREVYCFRGGLLPDGTVVDQSVPDKWSAHNGNVVRVCDIIRRMLGVEETKP